MLSLAGSPVFILKILPLVPKSFLMAQVELIMPKMGESITEATVLSWLKKPGDKIEHEEAVLEVATDKVDTEIPSTHAGTLKEILVQKGELVQVGSPIAILTVDENAPSDNAPDDVTPRSEEVSKPSTSRKTVTRGRSRSGSTSTGNCRAV